MKMSKESYQNILNAFEAQEERIREYTITLREKGGYKDYETRLASDCLRAFIGTSVICNQYYEVEGLNDTHITTASKKALRQLSII